MTSPNGTPTMRLRSLATANPPRYVGGEEAYRIMAGRFDLSAREAALYRRILLDGPIAGRYVAIGGDEEVTHTDPDALIARYQSAAVEMAARASRVAMEQAGVQAGQVQALMVNSCTGYLCPGLSGYVAQALGLSPDAALFDLQGMGCGGAIPNWQAAAGHLALRPERPVLSVAAEVCSATLFMGPQEDLVVSNCLFGDGAAATVLASAASGDWAALPGLAVLDFAQTLLPQHRDDLRYRHEGGRLRNVLGARVPVIAARAAQVLTERLLARHGMTARDVAFWAVHPGGSTVLDRVQRRLGLPREALAASWEVLSEYGNMSSPSVLFVLRRILDRCPPGRGQRGVMLAFGAGFTAFGALLEA